LIASEGLAAIPYCQKGKVRSTLYYYGETLRKGGNIVTSMEVVEAGSCWGGRVTPRVFNKRRGGGGKKEGVIAQLEGEAAERGG